jgi:hypothetical protein
MDKQPTFAERTRRMRASADTLRNLMATIEAVAAAIHAEADRMAAAEKRFAERKQTAKEPRS